MKTLYFLNRSDILSEVSFVPIKPKSADWHKEVNPTRLVRSFEFESYSNLTYFVLELMKYADKIRHHPNITIGTDSVLIETWTHDINDVTEQDFRLTKMINQIYRDIEDFSVQEEEIENVDNDERLAEGYRFDWTTDW